MAGAPKGNKNALKHGLWATKAHAVDIISPSNIAMAVPAVGDAAAGPLKAIRYLEVVMDELYARMKEADSDEFTRPANALSLAATALFNGHRTVAFLTGGMTPIEDAVKELKALDFQED